NDSTSEAVCNGVWNEILQRHFLYPRFIIAPEQRQATGGRPNLTIFTMDRNADQESTGWHPIFTFKGKAPRHQRRMLAMAKNQAAGYLQSLSWPISQPLACGESFAVITLNLNNGILSQIGLGTQNPTGPLTPFSLENNGDAAGFDQFCSNLADGLS
ncbi:uncharacterized protein B0I36DRAFT_252002, partial [Microdochium trichocladiopsis]